MDIQQAMKNPMRVFGTPETLEASIDYAPEEKRVILLQWKDQLQQLLTADDESMLRADAKPGANADCLRRVTDILTRLTPGRSHVEPATGVTMKASDPRIIVSSRDLERLEKLLESLPAGAFPGKSALESELGRAEVVEPEQIPPNVVTMNSTVRFVFTESGEDFRLTLVYPKDAQGEHDRISILAPVGSALLGLAAGDEIQWPKPGGGMMTVRVIDVSYQPERSGELHR